MALHTTKRHNDFRGISLCAGVGGLDLGLHIAEPGYRTVCHVERNSYSAATLVARMADTSLAPAPVWDNLKSFDGNPWRGKVHIITAGYPCQPFTLSGNRKGNDDPRHLWPEVARITSEVQPEWVFFENVPGHLTLGFQDVCRDLQEMGYRIAARVVSAAEVGGTHTRERVFILGHADCERVRQPGLSGHWSAGDGVQDRSESSRQSDRVEKPSNNLDALLGLGNGDGMEGQQLPPFPPMPSDLAEWRKTLDRCPDLKPSVQRLDDGMALWVERSAAAGNGVVPLAAANAWQYLRGVLMAP
ncbi:DNA cytosine methyltransferase [Sulfitobacter sp. M28]|uniref:DNA cytosine methyltransferase n=1 Tax=Sulfitobacter sp. M28 TaxID=2731164 RepID=UPI0023E1CB90|nr:DNA cytosine methyltransferase [Sulfitobacter sp. M28]